MSRESAYRNHKIASKVAVAQQTHVAPNRPLPTLAVGPENHECAAPSIIGAAAHELFRQAKQAVGTPEVRRLFLDASARLGGISMSGRNSNGFIIIGAGTGSILENPCHGGDVI